MTRVQSKTGRPWKTPPTCPCCKWRARKWVPGGDVAGYYLDYCGDCLAAASALATGKPMPPLRFAGVQPQKPA